MQRDAIYSQLRNKIYMLSFCQFGNYLVQHMAEKGNDADKSAIADMIISNIMEMSFDKFASNVVECALKHWTLDFLERLFDELCHSSKQNPSMYFVVHLELT